MAAAAPPDSEARLIEKLRLIEACFAGAATDGERVAAGAARDRIRSRLEAVAAEEAPIAYQFTFRDLFAQVCSWRCFAAMP